MDPAALSGGAEARSGVPRGHALHPVGISAADRRAGVRDGSDPAAHRRMAAAGARRGSRPGILRGVHRRAVAVRRFHA